MYTPVRHKYVHEGNKTNKACELTGEWNERQHDCTSTHNHTQPRAEVYWAPSTVAHTLFAHVHAHRGSKHCSNSTACQIYKARAYLYSCVYSWFASMDVKIEMEKLTSSDDENLSHEGYQRLESLPYRRGLWLFLVQCLRYTNAHAQLYLTTLLKYCFVCIFGVLGNLSMEFDEETFVRDRVAAALLLICTCTKTIGTLREITHNIICYTSWQSVLSEKRQNNYIVVCFGAVGNALRRQNATQESEDGQTTEELTTTLMRSIHTKDLDSLAKILHVRTRIHRPQNSFTYNSTEVIVF